MARSAADRYPTATAPFDGRPSRVVARGRLAAMSFDATPGAGAPWQGPAAAITASGAVSTPAVPAPTPALRKRTRRPRRRDAAATAPPDWQAEAEAEWRRSLERTGLGAALDPAEDADDHPGQGHDSTESGTANDANDSTAPTEDAADNPRQRREDNDMSDEDRNRDREQRRRRIAAGRLRRRVERANGSAAASLRAAARDIGTPPPGMSGEVWGELVERALRQGQAERMAERVRDTGAGS